MDCIVILSKYLDHTGWFSCQVVAGVANEGQNEHQCPVTVQGS